MDGKNVFVAIALSLAVILFWEAFFTVPKKEPIVQNNQDQTVNKTVKENDITPSINQIEKSKSVTRKESIENARRVKILNDKVEGSISLKGGILDDLSFRKHKQTIEKKDNVIFLNPRETSDGYFVETGWTSIGNEIKVPTINSNWEIKGNNVLTPGNPVVLEWNNNEGLIFRQKIEIDKK